MTIVLFAGVNHIITLLKWPEETYWGLIGLGAAPLIVSIMSAFRGLFQGHENMVPTGVSMIIEQFARVVFGIGLTWFLWTNITILDWLLVVQHLVQRPEVYLLLYI